MAAAYAIALAVHAIDAANRALRFYGRKEIAPIEVAREHDYAVALAEAEIVTVLREPARQIVTLLHNRSVQLTADAAELEQIVEEHTGKSRSNPLWGAF